MRDIGEARLALDRAKSLVSQGLVPRQQLEAQQARYDVAEANLNSARENVRNIRATISARRVALALAQKKLADAKITAPMSGFVKERILKLWVPLVMGSVLLMPPIKYVELLSGLDANYAGLRVSPALQSGFQQVIPTGLPTMPPFNESFLEFLPTFFTHLERYTWAHLWFIAYLLVFTLLTVKTGYMDLGAVNLPLALTIATIKASLVVLFFMHMSEAAGANRLVFAVSLVFVLVMLFGVFGDLWTRNPMSLPSAAPSTIGPEL